MSAQPSPRIVVVLRNDDPSAVSGVAHERMIYALFEKYGVPQTLGVVPSMCFTDPHDPKGIGEKNLFENPAMLELLREYVIRSGSEVALHGFTHRTNRFSHPKRRYYTEFRGLGIEEQASLIHDGTKILEKAFGRRPVTFIPPWNRLDFNTQLACRKAGYKMISGLPHASEMDGLLSCGTNTGLADFPRAFRAAKESQKPVLISVLFHSVTVKEPEEIDSLAAALQTVSRDPDCQACTFADVVQKWPELADQYNKAGSNVVPFLESGRPERKCLALYLNRFPAIKQWVGLSPLLATAEAYYWGGRYDESCKVGEAINARAKLMLALLRAGIFLCGSVLAAVGLCLLIRLGFSSSIAWAMPPLAVLAGMAISFFATDRSVQWEIRGAGVLLAAGWLAAMLIGFFVVHNRG